MKNFILACLSLLLIPAALGAAFAAVDWNGDPAAGVLRYLRHADFASVPAVRAHATEYARLCGNSSGINGRAVELALSIEGAKPVDTRFDYQGCEVQYPRDLPPEPPYAMRRYRSKRGDLLALYAGEGSPNTDVSLHFKDGRDLLEAVPFKTAALAAGGPVDLGGDSLLVLPGNPDLTGGSVSRARGTLRLLNP